MSVEQLDALIERMAEVLDLAKTESVVIRRRGGETFVVSYQKMEKSPFDVPGVEGAHVSVDDIVEAVRFSRAQPWRDRKKAKQQ